MKPMTMTEEREKNLRGHASSDDVFGHAMRDMIRELDAARALSASLVQRIELPPMAMTPEQEKAMRDRVARAASGKAPDGDHEAASLGLVLAEVDALRDEVRNVAMVGTILLASCEAMEAYSSQDDVDERILSLVANQNRIAIMIARSMGLKP